MMLVVWKANVHVEYMYMYMQREKLHGKESSHFHVANMLKLWAEYCFLLSP